MTGARQGALSVIGELGLDLDAGEAIAAIGFLVDRSQVVQRLSDVTHRDLLVDRLVALPLVDHATYEVVVMAAGDGLGKDGRVAGQTPQPLADQLVESTALDQLAVDEVDPGRLALLLEELLQRIHG